MSTGLVANWLGRLPLESQALGVAVATEPTPEAVEDSAAPDPRGDDEAAARKKRRSIEDE